MSQNKVEEQNKINVYQWHVLYTKPRNEKKVTARLQEAGYEVYCPLIKTIHQWSDRKKKVQVPMFPSYIFIYINEKNRQLPLYDPGVIKYVYYASKPAIIRDVELNAIKEIEHAGSDIKVEGSGFERGQFVEIPEGPFKGMTGVVDKYDARKVLVYVEQLGCIVQFYYRLENGTEDK
jgi:transcription antitermination factor NusG